jgi:methyltransferase (TIGR00027 family)
MARSADDSWGVAESVGMTALLAAAARAADSERPDTVAHDPLAEILIAAAGDQVWDINAVSASNPAIAQQWAVMVGYVASRTAFFDGLLKDATSDGVRQVVIAAAGLDSRAWRLDWPEGTTVYEIDQSSVLHFKSDALTRAGHDPRCRRVALPVDLRRDWPKALHDKGFDPNVPTAWIAEGLMPYLPATAQDLMFERIQRLSASGSWVGVEALPSDFPHSAHYALGGTPTSSSSGTGDEAAMPNVGELYYFEERTDIASWLSDQGWSVTAIHADDLVARFNRRPPPGATEVPPNRYVIARR